MAVLISATRKTPSPSRSSVTLEYTTEKTSSKAMITPITMLKGEKRLPRTICPMLLVAEPAGLLERPAACLAATSAEDSPVIGVLLLTMPIGVMTFPLLNDCQDKDWSSEALTVRATSVNHQAAFIADNRSVNPHRVYPAVIVNRN